MYTATWLLTGLLLNAPPGASETVPPPRLEKGLEVTYRGQFSEALLRPSRGFRTYDYEVRFFVLEVSPKGADLAILTQLNFRPDNKNAINDSPPILRLEMLRVDSQGSVSVLVDPTLKLAPEKRVVTPLRQHNLQALPAYETGMFLSVPEGKWLDGQSWDVPEADRPPRSWKMDTVSIIKAGRCFKLSGMQQTADFERIGITRPQWRRADTVWISDRTGYAMKVERIIDKREPDGGAISFQSKLVYEHTGQLKYRERLYEDYRLEILKTAALTSQLDQAIADDSKRDPLVFDGILKQIEQHEQSHLRGEYLPYREALHALKHKVEAAKKGHIPPADLTVETAEPSTLVVDRLAPDFVTTELTRNQSVRLSKLKGKPIVLLYYQSAGKAAEPVLKLAQNLFTTTNRKAYILSIAIGDPDEIRKQHENWKLTIPILSGKDIYKLQGIAATPEIVVLDDTGVVRKIFVGWTDETDMEVRKELAKWMK